VQSTIKDVARHAGVSTATVSRVFNNEPGVAVATRILVERSARLLEYVPNGTARSLITSKTSGIGVLLPDLYGDFYSELIRGIDQTAQRDRYHVLLSSMHSRAAEMKAALTMMLGRVDGLIVLSSHVDMAALTELLPRRLPVVLINAATAGSGFDVVSVDNFGAASEMVSHLLRLGHRDIAIIKGSPGNFDAHDRLMGYRDALSKHGIEPDERLELQGDFTEASGYAAVVGMGQADSRPTAIFAANDAMALGSLRGLREQGLRVPNDIAVAGFDGIPMSAFATPSLTTVDVPISRLGEAAVERLLQAIEDGERHTPTTVLIRVQHVIRESCGARG
jgi:LacI family transcriptional regulator